MSAEATIHTPPGDHPGRKEVNHGSWAGYWDGSKWELTLHFFVGLVPISFLGLKTGIKGV